MLSVYSRTLSQRVKRDTKEALNSVAEGTAFLESQGDQFTVRFAPQLWVDGQAPEPCSLRCPAFWVDSDNVVNAPRGHKLLGRMPMGIQRNERYTSRDRETVLEQHADTP